ncbi:MAG: GNAT family N-acetyltransferase [Nocardioides sp.]|nr:GNAT family N-acetyltransferase [Nocardioides sp.]
MTDWIIRPMRPEDVATAERLSAESFHDLDVRTHRVGTPLPVLRPAARGETWRFRTASLLETDPGGSWVAQDATGMLGFATSFTREKMWLLATYAVRPHQQGRGIGRPLLDAALSHGRGCLRGMFSSSDPRAVRRYRSAGFSLHPQMYVTGIVDRTQIPVVEHVREAGLSDLEMMDSVDRRTRGAAHGPDHALLARTGRPIVSETTSGSGYAYVDGTGSIAALAATDRRTASRLMWAALAESTGEVTVGHLTPANEWALDVGLAARLQVHTEGYLALRGMRPPAPYIHHGALL